MPDLSTRLGRLHLPNPVLVASGTFGYAREMEGVTELSRLGGIVPKTVTMAPRAGNPPPRTVETASGMLNAIGLDNDGLGHFLHHHLPYLRGVGCPVILNIAAKAEDEFPAMAAMARGLEGIAALELNLSCPNVAGGIDFATNPQACGRVVRACRDACPGLPIIAKLTPLVTDLPAIARAAADSGADAVSLTNTFPGIVLDWRRRRPYLGNGPGGLSGPAIKPLSLRCVWNVARAVPGLPIVGIGGIATIDDVMDYLVAGASAVQMGTVNFYDPGAALRAIEALPGALGALGVASVAEAVGCAAGWKPQG
ncbi:MAG: dihydroorotate dehydrogenase [Planctomycetota bacterium]|nr:dihydroorotate dehydrogenase [Planctomycetota bacterium]